MPIPQDTASSGGYMRPVPDRPIPPPNARGHPPWKQAVPAGCCTACPIHAPTGADTISRKGGLQHATP